MKVEIRQETEADFSDVYKLNKSAFEQDTEARLVELLRNSKPFIPGLSLVATIDNKIVGRRTRHRSRGRDLSNWNVA